MIGPDLSKGPHTIYGLSDVQVMITYKDHTDIYEVYLSVHILSI